MFSKSTKFENLLEAVPEALVGMDQNGVIRFVNRQTESLFDYDRDKLVGQHIETLVPEPLWQIYSEHEDYFADPRTRSSGLELVLSGRQRDGTQFPVNISLSNIDTGDVLLVITAVHDVTKQKQALENAERIAAIVHNSNDAIIGNTLDGVVTSWNPAAERVYGYSSQEIFGKSVDVLSPQDRSGEIIAILARIKSGQPVENYQTTRVRKDGTAITVSLTVSPIHDQHGEIIGASTIARDMTKLQEALEAARSMIESSLDSLVAISPEGKITDANEATVKLTGTPRDKLIGTSFSDYFTDPQRADEVYQRVLSEGTAVDIPLTLRHHNGHERITEVLYNASVHRDASGNVLGIFAAARDVTKQRQAFEAARSMIESSLDSLVAISPEGKITDANEATVRLTGVPRDKLIGTSFSDYFTEPARANEIYQRVFTDGMAVDYPLTLRHSNGKEVLTEVLYNASVYRDSSGNVLGVFAAARDITTQRQAQREDAEKQAMELGRLAELEQFQRLTVGRELKMIELKKEIEYLRRLIPGDAPSPGDMHSADKH